MASADYSAKVGLGVWRYTADFDPIYGSGGGRQRGNSGAYALVEWRVSREPGDPAQGLSTFARAGIADHRVNRFGGYTGGGVVYTGLVPGRDQDELGLGLAAVHNGQDYERLKRSQGLPVDGSEIAVEATYRAVLSAGVFVQGTVQYVVNPNTDPTLANALVVGTRLQVSF